MEYIYNRLKVKRINLLTAGSDCRRSSLVSVKVSVKTNFELQKTIKSCIIWVIYSIFLIFVAEHNHLRLFHVSSSIYCKEADRPQANQPLNFPFLTFPSKFPTHSSITAPATPQARYIFPFVPEQTSMTFPRQGTDRDIRPIRAP